LNQYLRVATKLMHKDTFVFLFNATEDGQIRATPFINRADVIPGTGAIELVNNGAVLFNFDDVIKLSERRVCGQSIIESVLIHDSPMIQSTFDWDINLCEATGRNLFIHEYDFMTIDEYYRSNKSMIDFHSEVRLLSTSTNKKGYT